MPGINAVLATPEVRERLRNMGVQVLGGSVADSARQARDTCARNAELVKELRIVVE